jgi:hypothetical protein
VGLAALGVAGFVILVKILPILAAGEETGHH